MIQLLIVVCYPWHHELKTSVCFMAIKYTQREITLHVTGDERFIFTSVRTWNFSTWKTTVYFTRGNKTLSFTGGQKNGTFRSQKQPRVSLVEIKHLTLQVDKNGTYRSQIQACALHVEIKHLVLQVDKNGTFRGQKQLCASYMEIKHLALQVDKNETFGSQRQLSYHYRKPKTEHWNCLLYK